MTTDSMLSNYGFKFHPFPPAATGTAFAGDLWVPDSWREQLDSMFQDLSTGSGPKAVSVVGPYGSGKTYVLHWMMENWFKSNQVQPYYIGNPGSKFYDVADEIFHQLGRSEFSKAVWQALVDAGAATLPQVSLFGNTFQHWLNSLGSRASREDAQRRLQEALLREKLADGEEVAHRFAQKIVGTRERNYFTFRDFIPRSSTTVVPERREARYFTTLVRILQYAYGVEGVAFLLDEFEDVALGKRLARRQSSEYVSTLRRLLDTAEEEQFWLVLSTTPEGWEQTDRQEPALLQRFGKTLDLSALTDQEAVRLVEHRLANARQDSSIQGMWPFEDDAVTAIQPINRNTPRMLVKIFWLALASAARHGVQPPIPTCYVLDAERRAPHES